MLKSRAPARNTGFEGNCSENMDDAGFICSPTALVAVDRSLDSGAAEKMTSTDNSENWFGGTNTEGSLLLANQPPVSGALSAIRKGCCCLCSSSTLVTESWYGGSSDELELELDELELELEECDELELELDELELELDECDELELELDELELELEELELELELDEGFLLGSFCQLASRNSVHGHSRCWKLLVFFEHGEHSVS